MGKKRILYIMHVPWGWIKQRPHFFAENLLEDYDVTVLYKKPWKVKKNDLLNKNELENISIYPYLLLPFRRIPILKYFHFLDIINFILLKVQLGKIKDYDYVWYTNLSVYSRFKNIVNKRAKILYDCMDDDFEFKTLSYMENKKLLRVEREILNKATKIFCSAEYLKRKIIYRTGADKNILVVNNAVELPKNNGVKEILKNTKQIIEDIEKMPAVFMYIGTIAKWFDFATIIVALEKNPNANFVMFGPTDIDIPKHERIHHYGTVKREYIFILMSKANALVMPFELNELILSVNPVKLYEYIYASKPILVPRYGESECFEKYVYLYDNEKDFSKLVYQVINENLGARQSLEENIKYAFDNTWKQRYRLIKNAINK